MPENKLGFTAAPPMRTNYAFAPPPGVPTPEEEALVPQPLGTETNFLAGPLGLAVKALGLPTMAGAEQAGYKAADELQQTAGARGAAALAKYFPHRAVMNDHAQIEDALVGAPLDEASFNVYARLKGALTTLTEAVVGRTAPPEQLTELIAKQGKLADWTLEKAVQAGHLPEEAAQAEGAAWTEQLKALSGQVGQ